MLTSVSTVAENAAKYSKRAYKRAVQARKLQNIIMRPAARKYKDVILEYLRDSPVTKADIDAAEDIFGPNMGSLKGKTVRRPNQHVASGIDAVPAEVIKLHQHLTLAIDIMFVNKVPFFVTKSRDLQFTTIEALPNRQVRTVKDLLKKVLHLYQSRGFIVDSIFADHEFEHLRPWYPNINTTAADEHVPDIERHIRTIKDSTRSTYRMLPYRHIPRIVLIHLVKNAVFWLNAVPANDGIARRFSPRYIMTGQHVVASKHAVIPFGTYVQTHEEHNNDMTHRTMSCICLGPTGNLQGGHWFMSLTSGERVVRYRWTELPMPQEAIARVSAIGRAQGMPSTITYANRHGAEIADTVDNYPSDDDTSSDDDTYHHDSDSSQSDDDSFAPDSDSNSDNNTIDSSHDDSDGYSDDNSEDDSEDNFSIKDHVAGPAPAADPLTVLQPDVPPFFVHPPAPGIHNAANPGVVDPGVGNDGFPPELPGVDNDVFPEQEEQPYDDDATAAGEHDEDDSSLNDETSTNSVTESEQFQNAENDGRVRALDPNAAQRKRTVRPNRYDDFTYTFFDHMRQMMPIKVSDHDFVHAYVTAQMSAKKGLKVFGDKGADALMKELRQIVVMNVMSGCNAHQLTREQKKKALKYLMFLKEKRCGRIKGRGCADGRKQRLYKTKEETSSPTVSIEALLLSCMIDAMENRDVATLDIPGAFMQAMIDEELHIKFDEELIDLLCQVDPSLSQYVTMEGGRRVLYTKLNKALYGTVQASLLFWKKLSSFLIDEHGFERNPYDYCVVNKIINGKQFTIVWYVDDLKLSHADSSVVDNMIEAVKREFGKDMDVTIRRGKIHDYLGIQFDFTQNGKVIMTMDDYIQELIKEVPDDLFKGTAASPAGNHLFNVNPNCEKLDNETAVIYHHLTAKLLYLAKRIRPDLLTAVSFLCTRVQCPDFDDWKKLGRCLIYLRNTADLKYTLAADGTWVIRWWVDASYGVHPDMKSHTGATMSMGRGCVYSMSRKQKLNTRSSTEAELVGVNDAMSMILWTRLFLQAQGYTVEDNIIYQDNQSAMLLEKNGKMSSSKRTRHLEIRFFFVTDNVAKKHLRIEYCPTDDMVGDFYTKPLQGSKFIRFRARILGLSDVDVGVSSPVRKECVETNKMSVTTMGQLTTKGYVVPGRVDDESGEATSWVDVVRKKRPDGSGRSSRLVGKQSVDMLTLFTKQK